jgi:DNA polymerase-3 subunit gamma/tau
MLSTAAFTATQDLEEPPHGFILATEVHKIPATVLSRCQRHEFRRVPAAEIAAYLEGQCAAERVAAEPEALALIARAATGSLRDAVSLLDQLASTGEEVTADRTRTVLGTAGSESVAAVVKAIAGGEVGSGLAAIQASLDGGAEARQLARQVVDYLRSLLLIHLGQEDLVDAPVEVRSEMIGLAGAIPLDTLLTGLRAFDAPQEARPELAAGAGAGVGFDRHRRLRCAQSGGSRARAPHPA